MKHSIKSCLAIGFLAATMAQGGLGAQPTVVRAFIADALARGETDVKVPPVRARIDPGADNAFFTFRGLRDATIDFQGCDFFGSRRTRALWLSGCTNVTIRNLTFDYDPLPFTQARITAVDPDGEWDMEVVDGYPAPETSEYYWPLQVYGGKSHELVNEFREGPGFRLEKTGARTYRATGGSNKAGSVGDIAVWSLKDTGNSATLPCTVLLENCSGCRIENVSLYSTAPGFGFFELFGDGNEYVRCTIDRRPPETDIAPRGVQRLRSGNHDAFHSKMAAHGPILDGCRFAYHCDDAVNISSYYYVVTDVRGDDVRVIGHDRINFIVPLLYGLDIAPGDELEVLAANGRVLRGGVVESVADDGAVRDDEIDYLKTLGMWPGVPERCRERSLRIRLSRRGLPSRDDTAGEPLAPPVARGDAIMSSRLQGRGFAIRNCHFGPHRALGMRIRASNGVIENNVVERTIGQGLWMGPEFEFLEGGFCRNVLVRDNVFSGCGKGGVHVGGHASGRREIAPDAHEGVILTGNRVADAPAEGAPVFARYRPTLAADWNWTAWSSERFMPIAGPLDGTDPVDVATEITLATEAGLDGFLVECGAGADAGAKFRSVISKGFLCATNRSDIKIAALYAGRDAAESAALAEWLERNAPGVEIIPLSSFARVPVSGDDFEGRLAAAIGKGALVAPDAGEPPAPPVLIESWNYGAEGSDAALLPSMRRLAFSLHACKRALSGRGRPGRDSNSLPMSSMWAFWNRASPHGKAYAYPAPDVTLSYGPNPRQTIDLWLPDAGDAAFSRVSSTRPEGRIPLAVGIHGGGWNSGDPHSSCAANVEKCRKRGIAFATVTYRLIQDAVRDGVSPPVRYPLEDALAAVRLLKERAPELGLDPSRILLFGGSAGACSSLYIALQNDCELGICAVFADVPQTSMDPAEVVEWIPNQNYGGHAFGYRDFKSFLAERDKWIEWIDRYSPAALVRRCTPAKAPTIFYHANPLPPPGELPKDTAHSGMFCVKFREICEPLGVSFRPGSLEKALDFLSGF